MKLNKPVKILVGLATLWFAIYPFLFFAVWLLMFGGILVSAESSSSDFPLAVIPFLAIFPLHFCTIFLSFILMAFYLVHVIKNTTGHETIRIILALGNFFMPFLSMPIYFYLFIWLENPPDWALAPKPAVSSPTVPPRA